MPATDGTTVTRRTAIATGALAVLAAVTPVAVVPAPTIDEAERLLADFAAVLVRLDDVERSDLSDALDRLQSVALAWDPTAMAAELERPTGDRRASIVDPWAFE